MISINQGRLCTSHQDTEKRPCAKLTMELLEDTTQHIKCTSKSPRLISGQKWSKISMTHKLLPSMSATKKINNQRTPLAPLPILERPNLRIHADLFGPMITVDSNKKFLVCITDACTKYAVVTKMLKRWPTPFTEIASPNLEFRPRFTPTEARNLSISSPRSFSNSWMSDTPKLHRHILSAMPKWKYLIRQWKSSCNHSWTIQHLTGKLSYWPYL